MSSPAGPPPLPCHARRRLESERLGDGRNKSGLRLHSASRWKGLSGYTRPDLEPLSFDDLPLGGEWTTRRRTISESEIALFAGVSGDFSPLSIEAGPGQARVAPPALLVAVAIGLGTIDMPVPSVEEWEWLNWKFPRPVHAGDTIYARWTLTQKRPPIGAAPNSVVVWRVDVHTSDGVLCAEGEVGAKVRRHIASKDGERPAAEPAAPTNAATPRRRRRRRPAGASGPVSESPAVAAPPASVAKPERATGAPRRRRRRRPSGGAAARDGEPAGSAAPPPEAPPSPPTPATPNTPTSARGGLSGVIRRLRRT
jgi:acyl dehydratase